MTHPLSNPSSARTPHRALRAFRRNRGFTLVELLAALAVAAILFAVAVRAAAYAKRAARDARARADIETLRSVLDEQLLASGAYPLSLTNLAAQGASELELDAAGRPLDPWGRPYVYTRTGPKAFLLYSLDPPRLDED